MTVKYITMDEAQDMIPEVRRKLLKIMKLNRAIEILSGIEISYIDDIESMFSDVKMNKKFHMLCFRLFTELEFLMERGAVLDSLEEGTVNFYTVHNSKPFILCWKIGDRHIKYWHEVGEDFSERKPLSALR